jgi:hypothetical protein
MESGDFARADLEIQQLRSLANAGGSFIAQWWSGFLHTSRLISRGKFSEAGQEARFAFDRGQLADEPGRLVIMLEQQTLVMIESIIPPELSTMFQGQTTLLANHYARVLAALANASLGNRVTAEQYITDTLSIFEDSEKEAAWLTTVTMLVETAHLVKRYDIASRGVDLLEPYSRQHVTYIGNTIRGPVRRYCGLAKHAAGDLRGAIDDLLMARNESRRIGDHLWDLTCSVDILEALAESDPDRFESVAQTLREDGGWVDSGENDNAIVQCTIRSAELNRSISFPEGAPCSLNGPLTAKNTSSNAGTTSMRIPP